MTAAPANGPWWNRLRRVTSGGRNYLPEIDGLRFVAIASVLVYHVWYAATLDLGSYPALAGPAHWLLHVRHGDRGVELFFTISGFILGLPFAQQFLGRGQPVAIGKYFRRRLTRLEPPYVVALAGFYLLALVLHTGDADAADFQSSFWLRLVYAYGLVRHHFHSLNGVTWSLEIEVQFYLVAPLVARIFLLPAAARRALMLAAIGAGHVFAREIPYAGTSILAYAQYFLIGFLLADLQVTAPPAGHSARLRRAADGAALLGMAGFALVPEKESNAWLIAWVMLLLVAGALRGDMVRRVLSVPLLTVIGGMCYSIYLIHYPLMSVLAARLGTAGMGHWQASLALGAAALPLAAIFSLAFFVLLERPCMDPAWPSKLMARLRRQPS